VLREPGAARRVSFVVLNKTLTVILYGADRTLWAGERPRLRFIDPNQSRVKSLVDMRVDGAILQLNLDLPFGAGQTYVLAIEVRRHRTAWTILSHGTFFRVQGGVTTESSEAILRLLLVPNVPGTSDLGNGFDRIEQQSPLGQIWDLTRERYDGLSIAKQTALLNIEAKLRETFVGGQSLLARVTGLRGIAVDRLFVMVEPNLKQAIDLSADFAGAAGHGAPGDFPGLPAHPDSWKHQAFDSGNLQLSFASDTEEWPAGSGAFSFSVDADIDLAQGAGHAVEWLHNNVFDPGHTTDQKRIYSLLFGQNILPLYTLDPLDA
jgi:hypothetical protein